jgi:hypothetical protein
VKSHGKIRQIDATARLARANIVPEDLLKASLMPTEADLLAVDRAAREARRAARRAAKATTVVLARLRTA